MVFTEDQTGLLQRVVTIFTRRHINIKSLTTSQSSIEGIHRFTVVVDVTADTVERLVAQLERQVDVLKAFHYQNEETVYQEVALYKVPTAIFSDGDVVEQLLRRHNARVLSIEPAYVVIEKTGHPHETEQLLTELRSIGIYEFARSGRVAVVKQMERLSTYLKGLEVPVGEG